MQCTKCHADVPSEFSFCPKCGALLQRACPQCGFQVSAEFAFCPKCGCAVDAASVEARQQQSGAGLLQAAQRLIPKEYVARLSAMRGQASSERRVLTILFCDVKGSTAMGQSRDPEEVKEIMDGAFEHLILPIYRHEGTLAQVLGDAVLAFFGAPIAHEDDPERAIRAGLEIVAESAEYAKKLEKEKGIAGFGVRVGINTGLVVVGELGTDLRVEYTAVGDAINLAARMEQNAPVGGILITHDTYRHVRGVFDVQAQPPLMVKGKSEPVQTYLVQRAKPRAFRLRTRGVAGIETRMVGRDAELKRLQDAYLLAAEDHERQMVTITGEAGVGKSRLLYEFSDWIELRPETIRIFQGRAGQQAQNLPYGLLRDLFAFRFQILDSDPPALVREKMEAGLAEAMRQDPAVQMKAHILGQLLGFDFRDSAHVIPVLADPAQLTERALLYLTQFFQATAALLPTLILLEDLHWADGPSLDAVQYLAQHSAGQRLLIVCVARPGLFERRPHWGEGQAFHQRLWLQPLSKLDARRLVADILQKAPEVPTELRDLVVSGAEGNPFYVEELIKMLIEDGVVLPGEDESSPWRVDASRLGQLRVPPTLTGVLQARLDGLALGERATLQWASVVGRTFWSDAVQRIAEAAQPSPDEAHPQAGLEQALAALREREMVFRHESSAFASTQEYIFKHTLLHEVTYDSVLKKARRIYHGIVADWLIEISRERSAEYAGLIAEHLERAGRAQEALPHLLCAGELAAARCANAEALGYLTRALALTPVTELALRYALLHERERVYDRQGAREAQRQDLEDLQTLAERSGDERRRAEVALRRANLLVDTNDPPAAIAQAQAAIASAQAAHDLHLEAEGHWFWGRALWRQGDYPSAQAKLQQALILARAAVASADSAAERRTLQLLEANALRALGAAAKDNAVSEAYYQQCLHIYRAIGDHIGEAQTLSNLGALRAMRGEYEMALAYYDQALQTAREIGARRVQAVVLVNLGCSWNSLGAYGRARDYHRESLGVAREINALFQQAYATANVALALHNLGEHQKAYESAQQAQHLAQEGGFRREEAYAWMNLGLALEGLRRWDEATDAYRKALDLRRALAAPLMALEPMAGLARVCLAQGSLAEASALVEQMLPDLERVLQSDLDEPLRVPWTCYQVLQACGDARARAVLEGAHRLLQALADHIQDQAMRRSFLENVPWHREIAREYAEAVRSTTDALR